MRNREIIIAVLIFVLFIAAINIHGKRMDRITEQQAEWYEACVSEAYGTTPTAWFEEHGEYPKCE